MSQRRSFKTARAGSDHSADSSMAGPSGLLKPGTRASSRLATFGFGAVLTNSTIAWIASVRFVASSRALGRTAETWSDFLPRLKNFNPLRSNSPQSDWIIPRGKPRRSFSVSWRRWARRPGERRRPAMLPGTTATAVSTIASGAKCSRKWRATSSKDLKMGPSSALAAGAGAWASSVSSSSVSSGAASASGASSAISSVTFSSVDTSSVVASSVGTSSTGASATGVSSTGEG